MRTDQEIQFLSSPDGVRVAYSEIGIGSPLVRVAPWLSHLDLEWKLPEIRNFYLSLASANKVIRYDSPGCGLSDWPRREFSVDAEVRTLEMVADGLGLNRFALFGYDAGGPVAVTYAARHPERVSALILFGTLGYAGHAHLAEVLPDALRTLMSDYWMLAARLLADIHAPEADGKTLQALANLYFQASTGENAVRATEQLVYDVDVTALLPEITVPATVIHRISDPAMSYRAGRELAAQIPNSRFVPLDGSSHLPYLGDAQPVLDAIRRALGGELADAHRESVAWCDGRSDCGQNGDGARIVAGANGGVAQNGHGNLNAPHSAAECFAGLFRREGEYWTIAYLNNEFRIRDSRGLCYLAQLLQHPNRELQATELEFRSESGAEAALSAAKVPGEEELSEAGLHTDGPGDAGEMLDAQAKSEYRSHLHELREMLAEAKHCGDVARAARLEDEIEFLARELTRAVGIGGRDRRAASIAHRARVNVSRAIRRSIEKIRTHDPALAAMLTLRIKTGIRCEYRSDENSPITWEF